MLQIRKILCPTDMSNNATQAVKYAYDLAILLNAELIIFHAVNDSNEVEKIKTEKELNSLVDILKSKSNSHQGKVTIAVAKGKAEDQIVEFSSNLNIDLIVFALKGSFDPLISITKTIMEKTPCSILGVPLDYLNKPIQRIVCATNVNNTTLIDFSTQFAEHFKSRLDFHHVVRGTDVPKEQNRLVGEQLDKLIDRYKDKNFSLQERKDLDPVNAINHFAISNMSDLKIISSSTGMKDDDAYFDPTFIFKMIDTTSIPVLVYKWKK